MTDDVDLELELVRAVVDALSSPIGVARIPISDVVSRESAMWCAREAARRMGIVIRTGFLPDCSEGADRELVVVRLLAAQCADPPDEAPTAVALRVVP